MNHDNHPLVDRGGVLLMAAATVVLTIGALWFGIWEPWEAETARVMDAMAAKGSWLTVLHGVGEQAQVVPELPYGWWPVRATTAALGTGELGLRLPSLLITLAVLWVMLTSVRRLYGPWAALFSGAAVLAMPLFAFHARHAMGLSVGSGFMALGALGLIHAVADREAKPYWLWLGWGATALSALTTGVTGLAAPALAGLAAAWDQHRRGVPGGFSRLLAPLPLGVAVALTGAGWAVAVLSNDGVTWASMLLWVDPIIPPKTPGNPGFEQFVQQLGFGLFPLGALLPFAFGSMLWADPPEDEPEGAAAADPAVAIWFAAAFLGPAIAMPATGTALFAGAPAVAIAVGVYLARAVRGRPAPILVLGAVLILALLDSNLKHDTHYLAQTVVGAEVADFPDKLSGWSFARLLSVALLGVLALYQANLKGWVKTMMVKVAYPRRIDAALLLIMMIGAVALASIVMRLAPEFFDERLVNAPNKTWRRLVPGIRGLLVFLGVWVPCLLILYTAVWARIRQLNGRTTGAVTALAEKVDRALHRPMAGPVAVLGVLLAWGVFFNLPVAQALTRNFSEKHLLQVYNDQAGDGEQLYRHRLSSNDRLFYARDLEDLSLADFNARASGPERFFALIPRKRLADVHSAFRKAAGKVLPVLDDTSHRYLLVSNQIGEGEKDLNPIRNALVEALPKDAHKISINFENKIELVGWRLIPAKPRRGSPLKVEIYWKVLADLSSDYKVFVHIDAAGARIHGDHDPVEGLYPTSKWGVGELIRDVHTVTPKKSGAAGRHTFYAGLFRGSRRMTIRQGPKDKENRARLGYVDVR